MRQVIYIWNYLEWGGAQIYFFGLIKEVKKHADVLVIMPKGSDGQLIKFVENLDVPYVFFDSLGDIKPAKNLVRKIERHQNKIKAEKAILKYLDKFDLSESIVHIELAPWQSLILLRHLCQKTTVFLTMHNSLPPVPNWRYFLWKLKFSILTKYRTFNVFCSNKDAKKSLKPLLPKEFYEKIKVTYTNVNPDEVREALEANLNNNELLEKYNIPKDKFLIFCVGQFIDRKGRWTFLEAAQKAFQSDGGFAFVWISNSKPTTEDLEKAEGYGLGENFVFITSDQVGKEHIDLFKLMRLADAFALVSFQEGLPISLLEAMALGIPSISTNVNAIPEAVRHLETGWLIEPGDSEHLSQAFLELKKNDRLREDLSKNGRAFVLENFNEKTVAQIALEAYQQSFQKIK